MASAEYLVFISHSSEDQWIARQMARLIEERDLRTFFDEKDFQGGDLISESIKKKIQECDELLVLLSPHSSESDWVKYEIGAAWVLSKRIVAIVYYVSPEQMPDELVQRKVIDLNAFDDYLEELAKRTKRTTL